MTVQRFTRSWGGLTLVAAASACTASPSARHVDPIAAPALVPTADAGAGAATAADQYLTIDGVRTRVRVEGPADKPAIILIHGFSFSLDSFDGWAADLARDHRVIRFDLAGHGLSDADPKARYGTADRVRQLIGVMDALGIRRATLAGNSFGGLVAWNAAVDFPDRVDRLILIDSAAYSINGVTEKPVPVPPPVRAYLLGPTPPAVAFSATTVFAHPERLAPARLVMMQDMIARNGPALVSHLEQFTLPAPDARLARIKAPTLILWGKLDRIVPPAQATQLQAAIPGAQLVLYDDVGHAPQEEATAQSVADVRHFLDNQKGGTQ